MEYARSGLPAKIKNCFGDGVPIRRPMPAATIMALVEVLSANFYQIIIIASP